MNTITVQKQNYTGETVKVQISQNAADIKSFQIEGRSESFIIKMQPAILDGEALGFDMMALLADGQEIATGQLWHNGKDAEFEAYDISRDGSGAYGAIEAAVGIIHMVC
jgi:hypothetical protein